MLELLFSTGLRVSELCALSKDTFLLNDGGLRLLVKGKGRKERILQIITPELFQVMQAYCDMFSKEIQEQGAILFNQRGWPLSPQSVRRIINKYFVYKVKDDFKMRGGVGFPLNFSFDYPNRQYGIEAA